MTELNQFIQSIDAFKQAVIDGRADLKTASKLIDAGMRIVRPLPAVETLTKISGTELKKASEESTYFEPAAHTMVGAEPAFETEKTDVSQNEIVTEPEDSKVELTVENQLVSTPIESLGLSPKTVELLKRSDNGKSFDTVESIKAFLANGGDLSDAKKGIGAKIEQEILSKLQ